MRILLVSDFSADPRLGSAKVSFKLREEFRALGHSCEALFAGDMGPPLTPRTRLLLGPTFVAIAIERAFAKHGRYDVVDAAGADGFVFGAQRLAGRHRGTAFVSRSNGLEHLNYASALADSDEGIARKRWYQRLYFPIARLPQVAGAARVADRLLLLNEGDRDFAIEKGWKRHDEIDVVPHGVSKRFLRLRSDAHESRGRGILFCGSWVPVKGVTYLAAAFSSLVAGGADVPLTILGATASPTEVLESFSREARSLVRVIPRVSEDEVIRYYRTHDIFVSPSSYEGFGMVVLEAMSQGMPVVATRVGCAPEVITHGSTGVLVERRDSAALAAGIRGLLEDHEQRRRIGTAAAAAVREYTWERTARRTVESYERALANVGAEPSSSGVLH